jgi:hypothetical protein
VKIPHLAAMSARVAWRTSDNMFATERAVQIGRLVVREMRHPDRALARRVCLRTDFPVRSACARARPASPAGPLAATSRHPTLSSEMKMQAVSPLTDFSFDFQDLLFTPVPSRP